MHQGGSRLADPGMRVIRRVPWASRSSGPLVQRGGLPSSAWEPLAPRLHEPPTPRSCRRNADPDPGDLLRGLRPLEDAGDGAEPRGLHRAGAGGLPTDPLGDAEAAIGAVLGARKMAHVRGTFTKEIRALFVERILSGEGAARGAAPPRISLPRTAPPIPQERLRLLRHGLGGDAEMRVERRLAGAEAPKPCMPTKPDFSRLPRSP
jgi:hypothetical protein